MAARCRSRGCWPAQAGDGTTFNTPTAKPAASPACSRSWASISTSARQATAGETVAFGKLDHAKTGDTLSAGKQAHAALADGETLSRRCWRIAVNAKERKDDVKLGVAFTKLTEEDPSISVVHNAESHEVVIWGQGEMHLRVAVGAARRSLRGAGFDAAAGGRLSRDHPQADHHSRPAQEAVRRPRPVRRHRAGDQAAAARLRLQVRGQDHRRRGAAQLHPGGGGGRHRRPQARAARLPGGRSRRWR